MSKIKSGVAYSRVSTDGQLQDDAGRRRDDASPEAQRERCEKHIAYLSSQTGIEHRIVEFLSDEGYSGKNTDRPGFQRMWDLIATRQIDFTVSSELSRLSRSVIDFLELISHCEKNKVDVIIIGLKLDTADAFGRMLIVILVALAQFEREMTSHRVKENALARLLKDGKINGAAEILGLSRDPNKAGHFLVNTEELLKAEKLLKLFLQFSSKKKLLEAARVSGITGTKGRVLTARMIDTVIENAQWRYRGLWYANRENKDQDSKLLTPSKQFQTVKLPHGPLINETLLNEVQAKLKDTLAKKKKSGKDDYIYLLSHVLFYEDGSGFSGQCAKNREYRYYHNRKNDLRIRCDEIHPVVIKRIKTYLVGHPEFNERVEAAVLRRQTELPRLESRLSDIARKIKKIDEGEEALRNQLVEGIREGKAGFMVWLEEQVEKMGKERGHLQTELQGLERYRAEVMRRSGLESLEDTVKTFRDRFDGLTGTEQRNMIEKIIRRITVHGDNRLEFVICGDPGNQFRAVTSRNKSTESDQNGGVYGTRTRGLPRDRQGYAPRKVI
jgi:DNA invertase Pin-like site-specific DNA recombinase